MGGYDIDILPVVTNLAVYFVSKSFKGGGGGDNRDMLPVVTISKGVKRGWVGGRWIGVITEICYP